MNSYMILVIVPYGSSKQVIKSAKIVGATGATIIRARGVDKLSSQSLLGFKIEPEIELIMIVATKEETENICNVIKNVLASFTDSMSSFYIIPTCNIDEFD